MKRKLGIWILALSSHLVTNAAPVASQDTSHLSLYHSGKARIFANGMKIEGKNLQIMGDKVTIESGILMKLNIDEVDMIEIRKSRVGTGAMACGGSCALLMLLTVASYEPVYSTDPTKDEVAVGGVLWVGISTAIGAGLGYLVSGWDKVYFKAVSNKSTIHDGRLALYLGPDPTTRTFDVGLKYRF